MIILLVCGRVRLLTRLRVTFFVPKVEEIRAALEKKKKKGIIKRGERSEGTKRSERSERTN